MDPANQQTQTNQVIQSESLQEFSDSSSADTSVSAASVVPSSASAETAPKAKEHHSHKTFFRLFLIASLFGLAALSAGGIFWMSRIRHAKPAAVRDVNEKYEVTNLAVGQLNSSGVQLSSGSPSEVAINGSIQVGGTLRLVPTDRPTNPVTGQQYIDKSDNKLYIFNGSEWLSLSSSRDLSVINLNLTNLQTETAKVTDSQDKLTLQGNSFNGAGQLVQLDNNGVLPSVNGSRLTNIDAATLQGNNASYYTNAGNLSSGTIADARLSGNVALLNGSQTFAGNNIFQNNADSTASFQIQNSTGTSNLLIADTANTRIGIGLTNPSYTLDVNGDINIAASSALRIGSNLICDISGCVGGATGSYIQNDTALQGSANFNIQSASDVTPTTQVRSRALQTANLSEWQDSAGVAVASISPSGAVAAASFAATGSGFSGNGSGLTALNATNITSGILNDLRLSNNVPLLDATQIFSGTSNTFNGIIYTNTITPTSTMTIGSTTQALNLQGNSSTLITAVNGTGINTNTTTIGFQAGPTNNRTIHYEFERNINSGTYEVCSSRGNCQANGVGGGVTAPSQGTPNRIAKFTQAFPTQIADSIIYDNGTNVGVGTDLPGYKLDVNGNVNTNGQYLINGLPVCGGSGCTPSGGSGNYIQNSTSLQSPGNFNIQSAGASSVAGIIRGNGSQTADIFQVQDGSGTINQFKVSAGGSTQVRTSTDSTSAFTIQNSSDVNLFTADTTNMQVGIGANYTGVRVSVETSDKVAAQINQTGSSNILNLQKSGTNVVSVGSTGATTFRNSADSTSALQIQNAAGTSNLLVADTTNTRLAIAKSSASYTVDAKGIINIDDTGAQGTVGLYIGGVKVCDYQGCGAASGGGNYIQNTTTKQSNSNFYIESAATGSVGGIIQGKSGQTADLFQLKDGNGSAVATFGATGKAKFNPSTSSDATDFFQVQNASASTILDVDTTNSRVGIGTATPTETLTVNGNALIGKRSDNAATTYTQYQATVSTGYPNMSSGTYTCNASHICTSAYGTGGSAGEVPLPSGWGTPNLVIIMPQGNDSPAYRTTSMPANYAKPMGDGGAQLVTGFISSMASNSFTVGQPYGDVSGRTYSYIAVRTESGGTIDNYFAYGSYTGNQTDDRTICINGGSAPTCNGTYTWTPDLVMVAKHGTTPGKEPIFRTSEMNNHSPSDWSIGLAGGGGSDYIQAFSNGGFQIGANTTINQNSQPYYWFAFKELPGYIDVGKYTGNGSSQAFTDPGFRPEFALTKTDFSGLISNYVATVKGISMGTNSLYVYAGYGPNMITSFDTNGFTLGGGSGYVNENTRDYYTFALKSFTSTSTVDGYSAGAVYNGKFYTATKRTGTSEIYRYDGGSNYTKVSDGSAGKITGTESSPIINSIPTMKVYDGKLFVGTDTGSGGNGATIYYCSNGSGNCSAGSWTQVNTTAGTLDGGTTNIDGIKSMAIVGGVLYVGTYESNGAEIYRYNGGTGAAVFTKITDGTAGKIISGDTANIDAINLINYRGMLIAGTQTGAGTAGIYYSTGDSNWSLVNSTRGTFLTTSGIDDVTALAIYNGSLAFGTGDATANTAEIYRYNAPQGGATSGSTLFSKISDATAGRIDSTGSARVDAIGAMTVYNGVLLASSNNNTADANGAVYKFDGVSSWSKLGTESEGTFGGGGGSSAVDGILFLTQYNDTLFGGSNKSSAGFLYTIAENTSMSYALKFAGTSDGSFDNIGSIAFMSGDQSSGGFNNQGQFLLSHTLTTAAGAYDIAEDYQTSDDELGAGDVVAIDPGRSAGFVRRADIGQGDGLRLLGIVSTHPAFHLSQQQQYDAAAGSRSVPVALAGRVPVKIDPASEPIAPGDYLAASQKTGLAIKTSQTGAVIAKALGSWTPGSGKATIEVFVSNTFLLPGGQPITSDVRDQIEHGLKKVSLLDAFITTGEEGLQMLKDTTFIGKVFFHSDAVFGGRLSFNDRDMAGHAIIKTGTKQVKVKFTRPYDQVPIISLTPQSFAVYKIQDKDKDGFTIELEESAQRDINFDWMAIEVKDPQTSQSEPSPDQSP